MTKVNQQPNREHSMTLKGYLGDGGNGEVLFGQINTASGSDEFVSVENNVNTIAFIHSHPSSHLTAPSPLDVMTLARQQDDGNMHVQASYVVVAGVTYSLQVTDPAKADAFYQANRNSMTGSAFTQDTPIGDVWEYGMTRMSKVPGFNEREAAALAYVLGVSDAGIVLSKMESGGKFVPYGVAKNNKSEYYPTKCAQ